MRTFSLFFALAALSLTVQAQTQTASTVAVSASSTKLSTTTRQEYVNANLNIDQATDFFHIDAHGQRAVTHDATTDAVVKTSSIVASDIFIMTLQGGSFTFLCGTDGSCELTHRNAKASVRRVPKEFGERLQRVSVMLLQADADGRALSDREKSDALSLMKDTTTAKFLPMPSDDVGATPAKHKRAAKRRRR